MEKIRILIADDHPTFQEGLYRLLSDEEDLEVIARTADGKDTVALAIKKKPDVAVIDVAMPNVDGIEATRQIKQACPSIAILIISAYDYEHYILASLKAGAAGYILKDMPNRELISAIRMVHLGEGVFDLRSTGNILNRLSDSTSMSQRAHSIHIRELEILKLTAKGMSNQEIARELTLSGRTVQSHLSNIFKKLEVHSRTEAVLRATKIGLLTLDDLP
ncbi:response regulator [Chloroflexota bacterium]